MPTDFSRQVYALVSHIPAGRVATYGLLALLCGRPRASRIVGGLMACAPEGLPCHRVVNRQGGLSDAFLPLGRDSQRLLLELEGVPFRPDGTVDLERCMWTGPDGED